MGGNGQSVDSQAKSGQIGGLAVFYVLMSQDNLIRLQCKECKSYNYHTFRNLKRADGHKLDIKKFCKKCRQHQPHAEKAKK